MKFATTKILAAALLLAAGTQTAFASSTNKAGDTIQNTAQVTFTVNGVVQSSQPTGEADFTVDRLVNVVVAATSPGSTSPGAQGAVLFTVTNDTNSPMDFALTAANGAGADQFDVSGFTYYIDDGDGDFEPGADDGSAVTFLDEVDSDDVVSVWVVSTIPNGLANGDTALVTLLATAHDAGGAGLGDLTEETTTADTAGIDNVFGDGAGSVDTANNGDHSAISNYVIATATISVTKSSAVVSDPFNGTTNPKAIPGATMVYCIAVANGSTTVPATAVTISDDIPTGTTYKPGTIRIVPNAITCNAAAIAAGAAMSDAVDVEADVGTNPAGTTGDAGGGAGPITTVTDLPVSATTTTVFQVTLD